MAFFSTPGIERLYSGVTNSTPFDFCSFSRKASQSVGGAASRSWLKNEMSCSVVISSFSVSGASLASALAILSVKLSLRRLPTIVTMGCGAAIDEILCWNGTGCLASRTCKKMQVHEIGFWEGMTENFYSAAVARKGAAASIQRRNSGTALWSATWRGDHLSKSSASPTPVRIDQIFFTGGALAIDGDVRKLQRLLQRHHMCVMDGKRRLVFGGDA